MKNKKITAVVIVVAIAIVAVMSLTSMAAPQLSEADKKANAAVVEYAKVRHTGSKVDLDFSEREIEGELNRVWKATNRNGMEYEIVIPVWCIEDNKVFSFSFEDNHDYLIAKEILKSFPDLGELEYEFSKNLSTKTECQESDLENLFASYQIAQQALKRAGVNTNFWTTVSVGQETVEFYPF